MQDEITVSVPATIANVTVGFDVLGFAMSDPREVFTLKKIEEKTVRIVHRDAFGLSLDPTINISGIVLQKILDEHEVDHGFEWIAEKKIKPGSGLGSSAASSVAPAFAAMHLLKKTWDTKQLLQYALAGEQAASGARHADNVAPCLCGGLVLIEDHHSLSIENLPVPPVYVTVAHPQIEVKTSTARATLPNAYPLGAVTRSMARLAGFVSALYQNKLENIKRNMMDELAEPFRLQLIPEGEFLLQQLRKEAIVAAGIAGSGPSIFCWSATREESKVVEGILQSHFARLSIHTEIYSGPMGAQGARIEFM